MLKPYFPILVVLMLVSTSFVGLSIPSTSIGVEETYAKPLYTTHDPIFINGNDNFTSENGVTGGSGTSNDPYIIEGWEIIASYQHGIHIENVNVYFKIRGCYIHDGGTNKDGIVFSTVNNGVIEYNLITENRNGILFKSWKVCDFSCNNNSIHHNNINDNTKDGICFYHTVCEHHSYNVIYLNNISGNNQGIYMVTSSYNLIFSNNILSNDATGVNLTMCSCGGTHNKVYHNNFINNGDEEVQAVSQWTLDNDWDDGYPSGGNFWSDYTGMDNYSGSNQNIPGSDGIGDTPYIIITYLYYEEDYDYYPLMELWGGNIPPFAEFNWTPTIPEPGEMIYFNASESYDYDGYITLYEWDWDNDGEYDENHTSPNASYTFEEVGYYPVTLRVHENRSTNDTKTKTVRVGNYPPYEPSYPIPPDGATNILPGCLEWTGGDPDGDTVVYDVYLGTTSPPPLSARNVSETLYCSPGDLVFNTTYYWKIVAWDEYGASTEGPIWSFTIRDNNPPDTPIIEGQKIFKVGEGVESTYTFYSIDPEGDNIFYEVEWGDGSVDYLGPYESGLDVSIDRFIPLKRGTYILFKIRAEDFLGEKSNWVTLTVYVVKVKPTFLLGFIENKEQEDNFSIVAVKFLFTARFIPFDVRFLSSGKNIVISNEYIGFVGSCYMVGRFKTDFD